jgi:hypothetical protein
MRLAEILLTFYYNMDQMDLKLKEKEMVEQNLKEELHCLQS